MKTENKIDEFLNESGMNDEEVANVINMEGMGYAIDSYLGWKRIENKKLAKEWKKAQDAMSNIKKILGSKLDF